MAELCVVARVMDERIVCEMSVCGSGCGCGGDRAWVPWVRASGGVPGCRCVETDIGRMIVCVRVCAGVDKSARMGGAVREDDMALANVPGCFGVCANHSMNGDVNPIASVSGCVCVCVCEGARERAWATRNVSECAQEWLKR